jgi:hypothetical protein
MKLHFAPAFASPGPYPEVEWLRDKCVRSRSGRWRLVDRPDEADAIVLCDIGSNLGQSRRARPRRLLELLRHPILVRNRTRCVVYYEPDVPKPYLRGLYSFMEWFPGVERIASAIAPGRALDQQLGSGPPDTAPTLKRDLLFSFVGRNSHPVRTELLRSRFGRADVVVEDTSASYTQYIQPNAHPLQRRYADLMRRSRWAVCPRGWSASSYRLFEAMSFGVAPVVLSDNWMRPHGIDWDECSLWVPESKVRDLPAILDTEGDSWRAKGAAAREWFLSCLSPSTIFEHYAGALEALLPHCANESPWVAVKRQLPEFVSLVAGTLSPQRVETHRLGTSAIERSVATSVRGLVRDAQAAGTRGGSAN